MANTEAAKKGQPPVTSNMSWADASASVSALANHRRMMAMPALKILGDLNHSEKSFDVLMTVMERCCREPNNQGVFLGYTKDKEERDLGFAFIRWFLGRFAIIFSHKSYAKVFTNFIELHSKILHLFMIKEPSRFYSLVQLYASLLKELVLAAVKKCKGELLSTDVVNLKTFSAFEPVVLGTDCTLHMAELSLVTPTECQLMQVNITKIITSVAEGITQYNGCLSDTIACDLLNQLNYGGLPLVKVSLDCLALLITVDSPRRVLETLLTTVSNIINLLCQGKFNGNVVDIDGPTLRLDIETGLINCISKVCEHYENCAVLNHHYIKVLCSILTNNLFHKKTIIESLFPCIFRGLTKFSAAETINCCRFNFDDWLAFIQLSKVAIPTAVYIAQSEITPDGWPAELEEPNAKRLKLDIQPLLSTSTIWDKLKQNWLKTLNSKNVNKSSALQDAKILIRTALIGIKLKLKWRETTTIMEDSEFRALNNKLAELLLATEIVDEEWMLILFEYLSSGVQVAYVGIERNVAMDWMAISSLPWLHTVSEPSDFNQNWMQISRKFSQCLPKHRNKFASCFVKFPNSFFKSWATDIGLRILDVEFMQSDAEQLIPSLPWIVRHGKAFREPIIKCMTTIMGSASANEIGELIRYSADIVCALSGKMNVLNQTDDGLILRCNHSQENATSTMKVGTIPEDTALFFLDLVFDESDLSGYYRIELFRAVLHHSSLTDSLRCAIIKKLHKVSQTALDRNLPSVQRTILKSTTVLVQFWRDVVVPDCFHVHFKLLLLSPYSSAALSWTSSTVKEIASILNTSSDILFQRHVKVVCDVLFSNSELEWRTNLISLAPDVFISPTQALPSISQWLGILLPTLIPRLVLERSRGPSPFFDEVCSQLGKSASEVIAKYFSDIYVFMLLNCDINDRKGITAYVEKTTRLQVNQLRAPNFQSVHNNLILHLHDQREKVLEVLRSFAEDDKSGNASGTSKKITLAKQRDNIAEYLRPRFLGILVHVDGILLSKAVANETKIEALSSLSALLQLMGAESIIALRLKVLATLRTALQLTDEPFPKLNAAAWDTFVRILGVQELGPLVSQIVVSILSLYSSCSEQIRSILYYIVVENAEGLKDYLKDLHFLPELPGLEDIVYSLRKTCLSSSSIREQLSLLMRNISHEDFEVRMQSLSHLKSIIQKNPDTIQQLVIGTNDTSEAVMTSLISALLKGCSVREEELLLLYGKCFGLIGAIDPGRLNFNEHHHTEIISYTPALIDDEFTFHLLQLLARSFLAPRNSQTLSILSFTIQQILKLYNSEDDPAKLLRSDFWKRFPEPLRVAFAPLTSSRYVLKQQVETGQIPYPVYRSPVGKNYGNWLYNWTVELIGKVNHPLARDVFKACLPTLRRDHHVNLYLLPYVVITALWSNPAVLGPRIQEEIMAVLTDRGLQKSPLRMMKRFSSSNTSATDATTSQEPAHKDSGDANLHQSSMQGIFYLLDNLKMWLKQKMTSFRARRDRQALAPDNDYKLVQDLVESIPNDLLARAAHQCQNYARAILHLEMYLKSNPNQLRDQLGFLQKLYVAMDEPDGVAGVCSIRDQEPSLEEHITAYEATGRLQDAFSCYERIIQREDCSMDYYKGMLRCLLNLDLPQGALTMANGLLQTCPEWRKNLDDYRSECCWRLGQWDALGEIVQPYETIQNKVNSSVGWGVGWGVGIGQALLATKTTDLSKMEQHLRSVRVEQMRVISALNLERNSYPRAYENFVNLHILAEMESAIALLDPAVVAKESVFRIKLAELLNNWNQRLEGVQASVRYMEPILNVRRVVLNLVAEQIEGAHPNLSRDIEAEIGKNWLISARLARKANHFQRAHTLQLVASTTKCPPAAIYIEQAKLLWAKGEQDQAISVLKRGLEKRFPDFAVVQAQASNLEAHNLTPDVLECLKAKLLLAKYYNETGHVDVNTIIKYYRGVTEIGHCWEEGLFRLAGYYDQLWNQIEGGKETSLDMAKFIVTNLCRSMFYGSQFIYQAMPRMLSLWMELGTAEAENPKAFRAGVGKTKFADITKNIENSLEKIPAYKFLTAFPQLISRICHPHPEVAALLRKMIAKTLVAHTQQCMWMMIAVLKSSYNVRAKRCREIIDMAVGMQPNLRNFFADATNLAERLVELANKPVEDGVVTLSIEKTFRALPRLLSQPQFSKIMMPLQWLLTVNLPTTPWDSSDHNPFPRDPVYVAGIEDTVEVMISLQKPKKIALRGSDGKLYTFLCKPQDDLRKDFRLMEFNQLINRYLMRDPDSRKRNLHIRTYGVIPLIEDCGLIEWVPNLIGLRHILNRIYREKGILMTNMELKKKTPHLREPLAKKREMFEKEILPRFPPVFSEWFLSTFPDPQDWYSARLNYVRTTAVMSMVGFIVGLGDRHGENILLDSVCGDTVHVDLSCLFNKGLTFEWPEKVPFRLTHNMIEAMGSTRIEGSYRRCCEVTLRVLRKEMDTLLSVLTPFVHDPLVEWSKKSINKGRSDLGEIKNEQALEHVGNIEQRLQGYLHQGNGNKGKVKGRLSVEGQVDQLIAEATDIDNLCQMYVGWAAYL